MKDGQSKPPKGVLQLSVLGANEPVRFSKFLKMKTVCGKETVCSIVLVAILTIMHFSFYFAYTRNTISFTRKYVFVFAFLGVGSGSLLVFMLYHVFSAVCINKNLYVSNQQVLLRLSMISRWYYEVFNINGSYYLVKMYVSEFVEHAQQAIAFYNVYLCLIPVYTTSIICFVLCVELFANIWETFRIDSSEKRDRILLLDIFIDLFCMIFPLAYAWMAYQIPFKMSDLFILTLSPTVSLLLKIEI